MIGAVSPSAGRAIVNFKNLLLLLSACLLLDYIDNAN